MRLIALLASLFFALSIVACDEPAGEEQSDEATEEEAEDEEQSDEEAADEGDESQGDDEEEYELAEDLEAGESRHFGAPFSVEDEPMSLSDAIASLQAEEDREQLDPIKVQASIEYVCESRGCWLALDAEDVDRPVRVRMKDYGFFISRNAAGARAVIEGALEEVTLSEDEARHYAEKQGHVDPDSIEGQEEAYRFVATGVEVTQPES